MGGFVSSQLLNTQRSILGRQMMLCAVCAHLILETSHGFNLSCWVVGTVICIWFYSETFLICFIRDRTPFLSIAYYISKISLCGNVISVNFFSLISLVNPFTLELEGGDMLVRGSLSQPYLAHCMAFIALSIVAWFLERFIHQPFVLCFDFLKGQ